MRILINDANILIDLAEIVLLDQFSQLAYELCTTDFVLAEIDAEQRIQLDRIIASGNITVIPTEMDEDYSSIIELLSNGRGLSFEDCTAWYYSQKLGGILVTGDGRLRTMAENSGIEVRGIIFLFDELLAQGIISCEEAIEKMQLLISVNTRLPMEIIRQRLKLWKRDKFFIDRSEEE
jgi:predicted nucleic acid-binding protein